MDDIVVKVLGELVPGGVRRGDLQRGSRTLRWVEAGSGGPAVVFDAALGEPGSLAWAGVLPAVAELTRVIAYDRAGVGASDPVSPLTVEGEVADLAALLGRAGPLRLGRAQLGRPAGAAGCVQPPGPGRGPGSGRPGA